MVAKHGGTKIRETGVQITELQFTDRLGTFSGVTLGEFCNLKFPHLFCLKLYQITLIVLFKCIKYSILFKFLSHSYM